MISRLEICRGIEATHWLESKADESSAGLKHVGAQKPLTY
jgi:hypothetical protein